MAERGEPPVDYESLADFLKALSNPVRLELLDVLRVPQFVGEIRVSPQRIEPGDNPQRPAARQTLQQHLDRLVASELVREERVQVGERSLRRYMVNPGKLYALTEEMRRLSTFHAHRDVSDSSTRDAQSTVREPLPRVRGPRLILVHGVFEGKVFPLAGERSRWTIGRSREADVSLAYDPFVSSTNAVIEATPSGFAIRDMEESRNGTRLNWETLPSALPRALEAGDVIGVGRSLLSFVDR